MGWSTFWHVCQYYARDAGRPQVHANPQVPHVAVRSCMILSLAAAHIFVRLVVDVDGLWPVAYCECFPWWFKGFVLNCELCFSDVLVRLATVSDLPLPDPTPSPPTDQEPNGNVSRSVPETSGEVAPVRSQMGARTVHHAEHPHPGPWSYHPDLAHRPGFALPAHSVELSQQPTHPMTNETGPTASPSAWPYGTVTTAMAAPSANHVMDRQPYMYGTQPQVDVQTFPPLDPNAPPATPYNSHAMRDAFTNGQWLADVDMPEASSSEYLDGQTLELLSTAPNSMEYVLLFSSGMFADRCIPRWSDWGVYINSFGGSGAPNENGRSNVQSGV